MTTISLRDLEAMSPEELAQHGSPNVMSEEQEMVARGRGEPATRGASAEVPVSVLISEGIKSGASVEALNGLYELHKRTQADRATAALNEALARFRRVCPPVTRNREGFQKRKDGTPVMYADLPHTMDTIGPSLTECGLSISWSPIWGDGWVEYECFIRHMDGASISAKSARFPVDKNAKPDAVLVAEGYCKRSSFNNATGITSVDEDASAAPDPITADQVTALEGYLSETGDADGWRPLLLRWAGVSRIEDVPALKFDEAVTRAKAKRGTPAPRPKA